MADAVAPACEAFRSPLETRVWQVLDGVQDPCMCLAGKSLSIVDMGVVEGVRVDLGSVFVSLLFTDPACLFELRITHAIERELGALGVFDRVRIDIRCDKIWTSDRLSHKARTSFASDRRRLLEPTRSG